METLSGIPVELDLAAFLRKVRVNPEGEDATAAASLFGRAQAVANPKAVYDICYVGERTTDTVCVGEAVFTSRVLRVNLDTAHRVFPYVATCGVELDDVPGVDDDPIQGYWLDEFRIAALSAASTHVRDHLEMKHRPGKMSSMSPGSLKDWPITQQSELFRALGDVEREIGVRLTDSYLMLPMKSVSGLYFPTETSFESCQLCPREGCPGRAAPYDPTLWTQYAEEKV
jgi:hypothetical protein